MTDRGAPPPYALVARVRNANLRPSVLALSTITGIWSLVWAIGFFKEISDDKNEGFTKLAAFALILGIIYIVVAVINFFGVAAVAMQRLAFIRIYSYGALLSGLLVVGAAFIRVITHFLLKSDLLDECVKEVTGQRVDFRWGVWGPHATETLSGDQAKDWCDDAFSHDSWSEIVLLIASILFMGLLSWIVWNYAHSSSSPAQAYPQQTQNPYYTPPYAGGAGTAAYDPYGAGRAADYAPPSGPPPGFAQPKDSSDELPGYGVGSTDGKFDVVDGKRGGSLSKDSLDDPFADYDERRR